MTAQPVPDRCGAVFVSVGGRRYVCTAPRHDWPSDTKGHAAAHRRRRGGVPAPDRHYFRRA